MNNRPIYYGHQYAHYHDDPNPRSAHEVYWGDRSGSTPAVPADYYSNWSVTSGNV